MELTILLTVTMMVLLFLMIWAATLFMPMRQLAEFFPEDVQSALKPRLDALDRQGMTGRRILGWVCLAVIPLAMLGVFVLAGIDGIRWGYGYGQHLLRFLIIGLGVKAFDIIGLDYVLLTKTQFFQHYFPETRGCAGWQQFGYNRKQQMRQTVMVVVCGFISAGIFTLIG